MKNNLSSLVVIVWLMTGGPSYADFLEYTFNVEPGGSFSYHHTIGLEPLETVTLRDEDQDGLIKFTYDIPPAGDTGNVKHGNPLVVLHELVKIPPKPKPQRQLPILAPVAAHNFVAAFWDVEFIDQVPTYNLGDRLDVVDGQISSWPSMFVYDSGETTGDPSLFPEILNKPGFNGQLEVVDFFSLGVVPEPSTLGVLAVAMGLTLSRNRRRI